MGVETPRHAGYVGRDRIEELLHGEFLREEFLREEFLRGRRNGGCTPTGVGGVP